MRTIGRVAVRGCLVLVSLAGLTYVTDDVYLRLRGRPVEHIKINRIYADVDHWSHIEYSIGTPIIETCVDALVPHFGFSPCWYLRRHTYRQIGPYF